MIESVYRELSDWYLMANPDADFDRFAAADAIFREIAEWAYQQARDPASKHHKTFAPMVCL